MHIVQYQTGKDCRRTARNKSEIGKVAAAQIPKISPSEEKRRTVLESEVARNSPAQDDEDFEQTDKTETRTDRANN